MSRIVIHIDRLVLNGIDPGDADALSAGLREALARSLGEQANLATLMSHGGTPRLRLDPITAGTTPEATGQRIGQHLTGGPK